MNVMIDEGGKLLRLGGSFDMRFVEIARRKKETDCRPTLSGVCLAFNPSGMENVWVFLEGENSKRRNLQSLDVYSSTGGSCEVRLLRVEQRRAMLQITSKKRGGDDVVGEFWLALTNGQKKEA